MDKIKWYILGLDIGIEIDMRIGSQPPMFGHGGAVDVFGSSARGQELKSVKHVI